MLRLLKKYKWIIATGIFAFTFIFTVVSHELHLKTLSKPSIATVNVNVIMKNYVHKQANLNTDSVLLQEATKAFVEQLEKEMKLLAEEKNTVFFVSEAVLVGSKDYTSELQQRVYQKLTKPRALKG